MALVIKYKASFPTWSTSGDDFIIALTLFCDSMISGLGCSVELEDWEVDEGVLEGVFAEDLLADCEDLGVCVCGCGDAVELFRWSLMAVSAVLAYYLTP